MSMNNFKKPISRNEGLQLLCNKYLENANDLYRIQDANNKWLLPTINIAEKTYPLFSWRHERRFTEMREMVKDRTLENVSAARFNRIVSSDNDIQTEIYRELDLAEWLIDSYIVSIYAVINDNRAANIVAKLASGVICTIEVAVSLPKDAPIVDKHEIIASKGTASDRVVDTQVSQSSIYLFSGDGHVQEFTDTDFELYGLSSHEAALVRCAFEMVKKPFLCAGTLSQDQRLKSLIALSVQSNREKRKIEMRS